MRTAEVRSPSKGICIRIVRTAGAMQRLAEKLRRQGRVGFVPTMGALHAGHLSLVRMCRRLSDYVVVSIFVNPTQFGPGEDLASYPRNLRKDCQLLAGEGVDVAFCPSVKTMYPAGACTWVEVSGLTDGLCGRFRPGHFRGVATVVAKLFNLVRPNVAVFGQKDAQQLAVIRRMNRDLGFGVKIVAAPTVREPDGLAMSSRNSYLSPEERRQASVLRRALLLARGLVRAGERNPNRIKAEMRKLIERESEARIQYIECFDADGFVALDRLRGRVLIALAVHLGRTRLIDNITLRVR